MKKTVQILLVVIGSLIIVIGLGLPVLENCLRAGSCESACSTNNEACSETSVLPSCTCHAQTSGVVWSGNPTYGSTTGSSSVGLRSVFCKTTFSCVPSSVPNHNCALIHDETSYYGCALSNGNTCVDYTVGAGVNHNYLSCVDNGCDEE